MLVKGEKQGEHSFLIVQIGCRKHGLLWIQVPENMTINDTGQSCTLLHKLLGIRKSKWNNWIGINLDLGLKKWLHLTVGILKKNDNLWPVYLKCTMMLIQAEILRAPTPPIEFTVKKSLRIAHSCWFNNCNLVSLMDFSQWHPHVSRWIPFISNHLSAA